MASGTGECIIRTHALPGVMIFWFFAILWPLRLLPFFSLLLLSVCRILPLSSAQRFLLFSFVPTVPVFPPWLAVCRPIFFLLF